MISFWHIKILKKCSLARFRNHTLFTTAASLEGSPKKFEIFQGRVLHMINCFLLSVKIESRGFKLKEVLNDPGSIYNHDGIFKETRLLGTMKAKENSQLDKVSPFLGGIADSFCAQGNHPPIANMFSS